MIEVSALSVHLAHRQILHDISFSAAPGAITAVIGPNGSGKSTLMKALCRDNAYTGTVRINGHDLMDMSPVQAAALRAVLPQSSSLPFPFTVYEVVSMGLTAGRSGVPLSMNKRLPEMALASVDLAGFGGRYYGEISGGEQQRVQLARVLCQVWTPVLDGAPRYLFLDEPVSSLDVKHQLMIMDVARRYADAGGGVIAILHDLNLAAMYADSIVALREGRVAGHGTPAEVLTDDLIETVFDCRLSVGATPPAGMPFVLPQSAGRHAAPASIPKVA
ncbi:iron complex transport system ATP-binding protein [Devosia sp. YR412]|uniref:heme ABC transporter ATP-binding protein n=1 Tax=Devosia sp. YR412 TaxID=1881030 RepID=UPI0008C14862|nr:heme ABC transporter ATP-binding protein [Devosia sp. YR412]SEQ37066.1 iron complex transport system ATP-binding protein [Devosia sp. YR412]